MTFEGWYEKNHDNGFGRREFAVAAWNAALDAMKEELMKRPTWSFSPEQIEAICNVHFKTSTLTAEETKCNHISRE